MIKLTNSKLIKNDKKIKITKKYSTNLCFPLARGDIVFKDCLSVHPVLVVLMSQKCFVEICHISLSSLTLKNELVGSWWTKVKITLTSCPSNRYNCDISGTPEGNKITSETNNNFDLR